MPFLSFHLRPKQGFTLIELMVSVAILAIVSSIGFVTYSNAQLLARDGKRKQDLRELATALELFYQTNKRYPCTGLYGTNQGWQTSNVSDWMSDKYTSNQVCTTTPGSKIAPTYINDIPVDPINSGNYVYQYYSFGGDWGMAPSICKAHQYYLLLTTLENQNDKDLYGKKPFSVCGQPPSALQWLNATYFIAGGNQ